LKLHEVLTIVKHVDLIEGETAGYETYSSYLEHLLKEEDQHNYLPLIKALIHMEKNTRS